MQSGYYSAAAGMVTQFNRLDNIANNLANVNTAGYKRDGLVTGDFQRLYEESRDKLENKNNTIEAAKFYNRTMTKAPQIVDHYTDFSVGNVQKSDNPLDFALSDGTQFFAVKTPEGIRLTRDGSFTLNEDGVLVTKQGYKVLPADYASNASEIKFGASDSVINADKDGKLYVNLQGSTKMTAKSALLIVEPANLKKLVKEGDTLYKFDSAERLKPLENAGTLKQGFIEKSNVNPINEMVAMIETNRLVGMYQKAMDTQMNDLNRDAIEKLAVVRR